MRSFPALRLFTLIALIVAGVLGAVYAIGRTVGTGSSGPADRPVAGSAGSPSASPPGAPSGSASAEPPEVRSDDRPPLPPQDNGAAGSRWTTGTAQVALTFDDGPDPTWTPQVLALLRTYHIKATFCMIGQNAAAHPDLVRAVAAEGHTLCNHSWSHDLLLGGYTPAAIRADLARTNAAITAAVPDVPVKYFRQPGGNWTTTEVQVASDLGMTSLGWGVDPRDWSRPGSSAVVRTVVGGTEQGSVVLMHDGGGDRQQTVTALMTILPTLNQRFDLAALPTSYQAQVYAAAASSASPDATATATVALALEQATPRPDPVTPAPVVDGPEQAAGTPTGDESDDDHQPHDDGRESDGTG